tara:strand:+ start:10056 stop:10991 length:936 start_codon:yes stop_codon:yes gene_type:complete
MKVLFDNVNIDSRSGPNGFAKKLKKELNLDQYNCEVLAHLDKKFIPDIQLSFIMSHYKFAPIIQRLDGIYFNSEQDFEDLNRPIKATYDAAELVIFQSEFNKLLSEKWFGKKEKSRVIRNGTCLSQIKEIKPSTHEFLEKFSDIWCCASSWRPHKRLKDNIRYFLENASEESIFLVAGAGAKQEDFSECFDLLGKKIFYIGDLDWESLVGIYKRSSHFVHLSWLDHCPNVVVDARAAGCHVICSSSGGTKEIAGEKSTIIQEEEWDLSPTRLYYPPKLDFSKKIENTHISDISIERAAREYCAAFSEVFEK